MGPTPVNTGFKNLQTLSLESTACASHSSVEQFGARLAFFFLLKYIYFPPSLRVQQVSKLEDRPVKSS